MITAELIIMASYVTWVAQPATAYAAEQQNDAQWITVSGDRQVILANGDIEYTGNVLLRSTGPVSAHNLAFETGTINIQDDGLTVLIGTVRFMFGNHVLTTKRATLLKDGTIKMDSAHLSKK